MCIQAAAWLASAEINSAKTVQDILMLQHVMMYHGADWFCPHKARAVWWPWSCCMTAPALYQRTKDLRIIYTARYGLDACDQHELITNLICVVLQPGCA